MSKDITTMDRDEIARRCAHAVAHGWTPQINCTTENGGGPWSVSASRGHATLEPIAIIRYIPDAMKD